MTEPDMPPAFTWETPPGTTPPVGGGSSPMTSGDIVDGAVSIYRRGFLVLLLVAAVIQVPLAFVGAVVGQRLTTALEPFVELAGREPTQEEFSAVMDEALPTLLSAFVTIGVVSFLGGLLLTPALIAAASRLNAGERPSLGDAYGTALRSALPILVGSIIEGIVLGGVFFGPLLVGVLVAALTQDAGVAAVAILLAILVGFIASAYVATRWAVWPQAVVLEARGPVGALTRSWQLVRGSMWRTLAILAVTAIVTAVAGAILGSIAGAIGGGLPVAWQGAIPDILGILTVSWLPIVTTLLFLDLRARREPPDAAPSPPSPFS